MKKGKINTQATKNNAIVLGKGVVFFKAGSATKSNPVPL